MYADFEYFNKIYPGITEAEYNASSYKAMRKLDQETSGVDGVRKLQVAWPTNEYDEEAVKRCFCELVQVMVYVERAKEQMAQASNLEAGVNGYTPRLIKSVSAGGESITYETGASIYESKYTEAAKTPQSERALVKDVIDQLRGISDSNGVSLLYQGPYPRRR